MFTWITRSAQGPRLALATLLALCALGLSAQAGLSVSSSELSSASASGISFVNYEGPQARIDSAASIVAIGSGLGQAIRSASPAAPTAPVSLRAGDEVRYSVTRLLDPTVKDGLEADIVLIGPESQVDHIKNLRRILQGYLVSAWGYSSADAATLAVYVTVYNAVHRGDLAYFKGKYKAVVTKELKAETVGLSLRYSEWPGKSAMVIPLARGAKPGALGAVDTGAVSDKGTTDSLKIQPGAGLGDRQSMTELKDREAAQKAADLAAKQEEIKKDEAGLADKKAAVAAAEADLAAAKAAAATTAAGSATDASGTAGAAGTTDAAAAGAAGDAQTATVAEKEKALAEKQAEAAAAETALTDKKAEAASDAAAVAAKQAEVAQDRAEIATDQKAVIAADVAAKAKTDPAGSVYLYQVQDPKFPLARIVLIDPANGKLVRASTINSIHRWASIDTGDSFVAVAGKEGGTGAVRLVRISKADLAQAGESTVELFADSALWRIKDAFYAVAKDGTSFRLVRLDDSLVETGRSKDAINPYTALVEGKDGLIVQSSGGGFLILAPDKLALVRELKQ